MLIGSLPKVPMIRLPVFLLIVMSVMIGSCSSYRVVTFTNDASSFKSYHHYKLEHLKTKANQDSTQKPEVIIRLEDAMHQQMTERRYQSVGESPDLLLRYEIISNQQTEYNVDRYAYRPSVFNPYGYYYDLNERNFTESILLLELKDAATGKVVWQGSLDLRYNRRSKKTDDLITDAVIRIFATYRYTAGSDVPLAVEPGL